VCSEAGDWYARNMYVQDSDQYKYHLDHYGHPSQFGFKDLCPQWTLLNWEPEALIARYKKAGARFFLALANHHDNFDAWIPGTTHGTRSTLVRTETSSATGRQRPATRLRFGVTVHQPRNGGGSRPPTAPTPPARWRRFLRWLF